MQRREKVYYSIGEVAQMVDLEQHVLRFWEGEFSQLRPKKNRAGNRVFRRSDIDIVEKIKYLLYEDLYTIEGAKQQLKTLRHITLDDYKLTQKMLSDTQFVEELKQLLYIV